MSYQQHMILVGKNTSDLMIDRTIDTKRRVFQVIDGDIGVIPANVTNKCKCIAERDYDYMTLLLQPFQLANVAYETINCDRLELIPHFIKPDPLINGIAMALKSELKLQQQANQLYVNSLTTSLSIHLIKNYSTFERSLREYENGLSKYKLRQVLDYINSHMDREIRLSGLATMVDMSKYYFLKLFKQSMGITPHQYVIKQRIEKAKQLLRQDKLSVIEVAAECGFSNQSHFAKVFHKNVGITPRAYRKSR
ncbi:AraC family transcriptional regulator [Mastigocoleus sp. MO_188.B34]|uniref:helix-turn-helix domain-containing protein n=1 Tax=Mastigocoleus sp. MO_188.B34 TaxID=3036635 RepID=UPI0026266AFC|nr:AraC family transcriptional regulator [Mastigocoleus sp. MO_188.B34]MDJ0696592.1 AraC family transcriptional regulator [Mastigocoleus sp. MO_188.B34]